MPQRATAAALSALLLVAASAVAVLAGEAYTQPFYRDLSVQTPVLNGRDVAVLQFLLGRSPFTGNVNVSWNYDAATATAVSRFQSGNRLPVTGVADAATTNLALKLHEADKYHDDGTIPPGYLYKVHIPVHRNRSIEVTATLYDSNMTVLHQFTVRTHGQDAADGSDLNQFAADGNTPSGLASFDLNSPEPDPTDYGPYPINRFVLGLAGNAQFSLPLIRNGILMHTGEWPNWDPSMPMPNSHGCVHGHPTDIDKVWQLLVGLGVQIHKNPFGQLPYPYKPQGIVSVEVVD